MVVKGVDAVVAHAAVDGAQGPPDVARVAVLLRGGPVPHLHAPDVGVHCAAVCVCAGVCVCKPVSPLRGALGMIPGSENAVSAMDDRSVAALLPGRGARDDTN